MRDTDLSQKRLVSYDVTSLFTNVSIEGALKAAKEVVNDMNDENQPLDKGDYLKLISLCVKFGAFVFNNKEYFQCRGLSMGSPLSCVLASLYMEVLKRDHFTTIMGQDTTWLRYVDDVLAITPRETVLMDKLNMLNRIEKNIQFTVEQEETYKLAFLDTVIWRKGNKTVFQYKEKTQI
ncbi:telomerase reverse transcriptase-like [Oratosquilla oratoria]|uniref:telomerase reverse transcriptase-like n=1 Tax=Oratosquilla oratoria TaxID=337810 RepID=UPI003F7635F7